MSSNEVQGQGTADTGVLPASAVSHRRRTVGRVLGPTVFVAMLLLPAPEGLEPAAWRVAAVAMLLAIFWLSEALPVAATALLPLALFPTLGVAPIQQAAAPYANPLVFLFLGGFVIGLAIERSNLHRRIALTVLDRVGAREDFQIAGFIAATAALSMWVSNTATAVMMLPVALSIIPRDGNGNIEPAKAGFATALLLSVAYGANIGGVATLIGTPPNALLAGFMLETYDVQIGFAQWMLVGLPVSGIMLVLCWFVLTRWLYRVNRDELPGARTAIAEALGAMGSTSTAEKRVGIVFAITAFLWISRPLLTNWFPELLLSDTGIAIFGALLLFVIPSGAGKGDYLMNWPYAERLPWGVLLLFGGGLSLAAAVSDSGLAEGIGVALGGLDAWPTIMLVIVVTVLIVLLTELTSNIATSATFLPIVAALAVSVGSHPLLLSVPAVLAASFAFMLPVATPPNAIVFSSGAISIPQMVRAGIWLNVLGVMTIVLIVYLLIGAVFAV
ncbi:SLC13 family permease [Candidatus Rariloculus sp.]|uniref:SLC13 family permease n=1 Tax=Candidatus Rariloculus sp. TaxID=3101265 RepID=UPI003D09EAC1